MTSRYILKVSCEDQAGIVASLTSALFSENANIVDAQQFNDPTTGMFFMRVVFDADAGRFHDGRIEQSLHKATSEFNIDWSLRPADTRKRVVIMVSQLDHCMGDLLYRVRIGELPMDVVAIVSNHPQTTLKVSMIGDIPYHYLPVTKESKTQQEQKVKAIIEQHQADLVILARYMQILSDDFAKYLEGRCVNIHHSSLPGFKGAKPYHQAFDRGVKLIGATAHLVTAELDEGPIIEQDIEHITHADLPEDLVRIGRDIERRVLAKAVTYLLEDRVFLNGSKTVVFRGSMCAWSGV